MHQETVNIPDINLDLTSPIDYSYYDQPREFVHPKNDIAFDYRLVPGTGKMLHLHDFQPWGWALDFPIVRDFNASCTGQTAGDISFYAMRGISYTYQPKQASTVLEQMADKWLETYVAQNLQQKLLVTGASLGGLFSAIVAAKAKNYGLDIPHVYLFEPASVVPKTLLEARKQLVQDTKFEYKYSRQQGAKGSTETYKYLLSNLPLERRILKDLLKGNLAEYVNIYLKANPGGKVHVFHSAQSSYITVADLHAFHQKVADTGRIRYIHMNGVKHGLGPHFRKLGKFFVDYITQSQGR